MAEQLSYQTFFAEYHGKDSRAILREVYEESAQELGVGFKDWWRDQQDTWKEKYNIDVPDMGVKGADDQLLGTLVGVGALAAIRPTIDASKRIQQSINRATSVVQSMTDPRESAANALLMRGSASELDILRVNYGTWPPRGLDIVTDAHLQHQVSLLPMTNLRGISPEMAVTHQHSLGAADGGSDRAIWLDSKKIKSSLVAMRPSRFNSVLAHEMTHIGQADRADPYRKNQDVGKNLAAHAYNGSAQISHTNYPQDSMRYSEGVMLELTEPKAAINSSPLLPARQTQTSPLTSNLPPGISYLQEGVEVQARMGQIMAESHPNWSHLPQNRTELWVAMWSTGLNPPQDIYREISSNPDLPALKKKFPAARIAYVGQIASELQVAVDHLPSEQTRAKFWRETMPAMYGDLIEGMGDRHGRARMGLGHNEHLPRILFGKSLDAFIDAKPGEAVDASIHKTVAENVRLLGAKETAHFMVGLGEPRTEQQKLGVNRYIQTTMSQPGVFEAVTALGHSTDAPAQMRDRAQIIAKQADGVVLHQATDLPVQKSSAPQKSYSAVKQIAPKFSEAPQSSAPMKAMGIVGVGAMGINIVEDLRQGKNLDAAKDAGLAVAIMGVAKKVPLLGAPIGAVSAAAEIPNDIKSGNTGMATLTRSRQDFTRLRPSPELRRRLIFGTPPDGVQVRSLL